MCLLMWPGGGESWYSAGSQGAYVQYTHFLGKLMYPSFTVKIYGITYVCFERDSTSSTYKVIKTSASLALNSSLHVCDEI